MTSFTHTLKRSAAFAIASSIAVSSSFAAQLSFETPETDVILNCPTNISIMLDTMDKETTAADIRILVDGFDANDFLSDGEENIFRQYTAPRVHTIQGGPLAGQKALYVLASTASRQGINKTGQVGEMIFTPKNLGEMKMQFVMIPSVDGEDSNVAVFDEETASYIDGLEEVQNITLNVIEGECSGAISLQPLGNSENVEIKVNETFVPQFAAAERKDNLLTFYYTNKTMIYIAGGILLLILLAGIGYGASRKGKGNEEVHIA